MTRTWTRGGGGSFDTGPNHVPTTRPRISTWQNAFLQQVSATHECLNPPKPELTPLAQGQTCLIGFFHRGKDDHCLVIRSCHQSNVVDFTTTSLTLRMPIQCVATVGIPRSWNRILNQWRDRWKWLSSACQHGLFCVVCYHHQLWPHRKNHSLFESMLKSMWVTVICFPAQSILCSVSSLFCVVCYHHQGFDCQIPHRSRWNCIGETFESMLFPARPILLPTSHFRL
jgi:hypothetical protein